MTRVEKHKDPFLVHLHPPGSPGVDVTVGGSVVAGASDGGTAVGGGKMVAEGETLISAHPHALVRAIKVMRMIALKNGLNMFYFGDQAGLSSNAESPVRRDRFEPSASIRYILKSPSRVDTKTMRPPSGDQLAAISYAG
jgi:hypothetical protein